MIGRLTRVREVYGRAVIVLIATLISTTASCGDEPIVSREFLTREQWAQLDKSTDAALGFLAIKQNEDGSFQAPPIGQPGITSLGILAFLSRGHLPGEGKYGAALNRAIDFVLATQQEDGLLFPLPIERRVWQDGRHKTGIYNHAISALMLSEVYGMTRRETSDRIEVAVRRAILLTLAQQKRRKPHAHDKGGWRYLVTEPAALNDSDLSVTGWQIMFLRSARNAGFEVPGESIELAMEYVRRAYGPTPGTFTYGHANLRGQVTRGVVGSAILTLSLGGEHNSDMALMAGKWILDHPFDRYNRPQFRSERYHYSVYYCSQAMFQLGGEYWERFFPRLMRVLIDNQQRDGAWSPEADRDHDMGNVYTTALTVLALTPGYQLLPIYQR
jgi:hypothetical protein